jgi:tetratricopeptide (TPR) repeat protein
VVLLAAAVATPAHAQGGSDGDGGGDKASQTRSKELYDQGSRAYKAGDYRRAVEHFLAAYQLSRAPAILFNIAQAYRLDGACDQALAWYRRSLAEEPDAANRAEVEERIAEMQRCADQPVDERAETGERAETREPEPPPSAVAPSPATVEASAPERPRARRSILPLVTMGAGAAVAVTGGIIYLQARSKFDEVEATCPCEPGSFSGWETATDASYLLMAGGLAGVAAGLIWWIKQPDGEPLRTGLVPTARGVGWATSF